MPGEYAWMISRNCQSCAAERERQMGRRRASGAAAVARAVLLGKLPKAAACKCVDCGKPAVCYDHRDYRKPLMVDPVCKSSAAGEPDRKRQEWSPSRMTRLHLSKALRPLDWESATAERYAREHLEARRQEEHWQSSESDYYWKRADSMADYRTPLGRWDVVVIGFLMVAAVAIALGAYCYGK